VSAHTWRRFVELLAHHDHGPSAARVLDDAVREAVYVPDLDLAAEFLVIDQQLKLRLQGLCEIPSKSSQQNGFS
jgi:hypothetical protein